MITITRSGRWAVGAAATSAALAAALAIPIAMQSTGTTARAATSTVLATFTNIGSDVWTVPTGTTTVTFTVFGASGGGASMGSVLVSAGGPGGEARGQFTVRGGENFEIVVGGHGSAGSGGFNGGGSPSAASSSGGGGGASDVRVGGRSNACAKQKSCDWVDRIVVGGGGGGGGTSGNGGAGGGAQGVTAGGTGGGQEQSRSKSRVFCAGFLVPGFGCGATSGQASNGAGGGGWWGGGWGGDNLGAGGGSGYVSSLALTSSFPGGTQIGDGSVVISTP